MRIGKCAGPCGQSNELHEGTDGRGYCEDCLVLQKKDPQLNSAQPAPVPEPDRHQVFEPVVSIPAPAVEQTPANVSSLDYIAAHASDKWIDKFLNNHKRQLKDNYGWVKVIEQIADERVLLRMAVELGYGVGVDPTVLPSFKDRDINYAERLKEAIPKKRANGRSDESYTYARCKWRGCMRKPVSNHQGTGVYCKEHLQARYEKIDDLLE